MILRYLTGAVALLLQAAAPVAFPGGAQRAAQAPACKPIPIDHGPAITFGREGGNIRPRSFAIWSDGRITPADSAAVRDTISAIAPAAVAALARLARTGGFWALAPRAIRRPTRNPDAARDFIDVQLTCGRHRVEYIGGRGPPAFAELLALLGALVR